MQIDFFKFCLHRHVSCIMPLLRSLIKMLLAVAWGGGGGGGGGGKQAIITHSVIILLSRGVFLGVASC